MRGPCDLLPVTDSVCSDSGRVMQTLGLSNSGRSMEGRGQQVGRFRAGTGHDAFRWQREYMMTQSGDGVSYFLCCSSLKKQNGTP